jgi:hypothetical protein
VSGLSVAGLLGAAYAAFLLLAAVGLDRLARHTHHRSQRVRTAGFRFHPQLEAWECPEGEYLWPVLHDRKRRLVRYRAKAHVCNSCEAKPLCTDSDDGREVVRHLESWPQSEAGRFHRVISVVLVVLAAVIATTTLAVTREPAEALVLAPVIVLSALTARYLVSGLRVDQRLG